MERSVSRMGLALGLMLSVMTGCKQDLSNTGWDVDVLAPVIKTRLTMADLVADSLLEANGEGALRLKVETSLINLPLDSILKIPDTTIVKPVVAAINFNNIPPGFALNALTDETQYELGDLALKTVKIRSGQLRLRISSKVETGIDFEYRIPLATKFGNMFISTGSVGAGSSSNPAVAEYTFDLKDYTIDLRGLSGTSFNTLVTTFVVTTAADGDTVSIPAGTFLTMEYSFLDLVPNFGAGYFGQQSTVSEEENSEIDVLNKITEGQMFLDSVTIGLRVINAVGADARFKLDRLSSINTRNSNTVDLAHAIVGSNILLTRAQDPTGNAQDVIATEVNYELNNANSNIRQFIENLPDQLGFKFGFDLNPLGNVSSGNDFFYYERPFEALMNIDIPLRTSLSNLTLVDTLDWNLSDNGVVESVNSGSFTLVALNGMPLEGMAELILMDENLQVLDTLLVPSTIAAPPLDADNKVIAPVESRIIIPVPDRISNVLPRTKKIRIRVRFNTPNQPHLIEFYASYGIDLKLIGNFNLNFGPSTF